MPQFGIACWYRSLLWAYQSTIISPMKILLTNDDGILAPGLEALYHAVRDFGEVAVVAPEISHSGVGHGLTVQSPIAAQHVQVRNDFAGWAVAGRPADCVKLAMLELLDWRPDFVISGINVGINTGVYVLYSGTVAGAAEGTVFFNIPSLAISLQNSEHLNFKRAGQVARRIFEQYAVARPPAGTCLNVNIPALDSGWPKGVRVCPQSTVPADASYRKEIDPGGRQLYWLEGGLPEQADHPQTDTEAVLQGYVAITPLCFHVTDQKMLPEVELWTWPQSFE